MASQRSFGSSCSTAETGGRAEAEVGPAGGRGVHKGRSALRSPGQGPAAKKTFLVVSAEGTCIPESLKGRRPQVRGRWGRGTPPGLATRNRLCKESDILEKVLGAR